MLTLTEQESVEITEQVWEKFAELTHKRFRQERIGKKDRGLDSKLRELWLYAGAVATWNQESFSYEFFNNRLTPSQMNSILARTNEL